MIKNNILVDSHCHLDYLDKDGIMDDAINRAVIADVAYMQTISVTMKDFIKTLEIANKYNNVFCSVGVHPCHVNKDELVTYDELLEQTKHNKVIGIGESGIDLFYTNDNLEYQEQSFRTHIDVSRVTKLPLIVHTRNAEKDTLRILKDEYNKGEFTFLIHCFTASNNFAQEILNMNGYISVSGILTFSKCQDIRDTITNIPIERLLVETDSPYLSPKPFRNKSCEPAYVVHTANVLAEVKNMSYNDICRYTTDNFFKLFLRANR